MTSEIYSHDHDPGPFFDDLEIGQVLAPSPDLTITGAESALYQAICGDPLTTSLSLPLAEKITGTRTRLVNPSLVMNISIGQSTVATRRVIANLFYRGVVIKRPVLEGETLHTDVAVLGLKSLTPREDRPPRGLALLGITTKSVEDGSTIVDYERCAMLKARNPDLNSEHSSDFGIVSTEIILEDWESRIPKNWDLQSLKKIDKNEWPVGERRTDTLRDTVSNALELVRLTQNQATVHRDPKTSPTSQRLVYGGHTIGLAQASLIRLIPDTATILGWQSCDHVGPVNENDLLTFHHTLLDERPVGQGYIKSVRTQVEATRDSEISPVLDWRLVVYGS